MQPDPDFSVDDRCNSAGPSRSAPGILPSSGPGETTIPSHGPEFFEYRRRLFLAGLPLPTPPSSGSFPGSYTIPLPLPKPLPAPVARSTPPNSSLGKLEALLQTDGAEETTEAWRAGLAGVHARLEGGKRLNKPLRLGLVIKVLKAGWIADGTWPLDPKTRRAAVPPSSPFMDGLAALPLKQSTRPAPAPPTTAATPSVKPNAIGTPRPDLVLLPETLLPDPHARRAVVGNGTDMMRTPVAPVASSTDTRVKQHSATMPIVPVGDHG